MRKMLFVLTFIVLLTACGQNISQSENVAGSNLKSIDQREQKVLLDTENASEVEQQEEAVNSRTDSNEKVISYKLHGEIHKQLAVYQESDIQDYFLFVLPGYVLTGEEPMSDILYFEEESNQNMRIQLLPKNNQIDDAVNTMKEQLKAVNDEVLEVTEKADWLEEAYVYKSHNNEDLVIGVLIEHDQFLLKLTIFTKLEKDFTDPFLKMAETITFK